MGLAHSSATNPASSTQRGQGCPGADGVPVLAGDPFGLPWTGTDYRATVAHVPSGTPAVVLFLGFSTAQSGNLGLPLDLTPLQMPGCALQVSPDLAFGVVPVGGEYAWRLPIPELPELVGAAFHQQAAVPDPLANPAGLSWSNPLSARIGAR